MRRRRGTGENQIPLFDGGAGEGPRAEARKKKRRERYHTDKAAAEFMMENPNVVTLMAQFLLRLYDEGRERYGMQAIQENFRWHKHVPGLPDPEETYKLNNNYTSRIARAVIVLHPELGEMLELRVLKNSRWPDPPEAMHLLDAERITAEAWTFCGRVPKRGQLRVTLIPAGVNCTRCKKAAADRARQIEGGPSV